MFLGPSCLWASRLVKAKFVWELRDLTWQYPRTTGKKTFGLDVALEKFMLSVARSADALVTSTNGQLTYLKHKNAAPPKAIVVPNGISEDLLEDYRLLNTVQPFQGSRARVLYAGLIGYPQGLMTLIEAAKLLPDTEFTIAGDGTERPVLEKEVRRCGLKNVKFVGYVGADELRRYYGEADILVAHLRDAPAFRCAQPTKLWEYMATGRPVILAAKCEAADIIRDSGCGIVVPPEHPQALADAITYLTNNPEMARDIGKKGRCFVETHRPRCLLLRELKSLIEQLI
jgi:glycosyltransferase involved in cell wall biosynthesis